MIERVKGSNAKDKWLVARYNMLRIVDGLIGLVTFSTYFSSYSSVFMRKQLLRITRENE